MYDITLLYVGKNAEASLRRNKTANDFLGNIFSRCSQQIFKLDRAEFLNDGRFLLNAVLETRFKLVKLALLLVEVLDKAATALLHLV